MGNLRSNRRLPEALAVVVLFVACTIPQGFATEIHFRPTATVSSATVLLKDVALVTEGSPAAVAHLENVVLAPAPAPGRRLRLDFESIRSRLEASGISAVDTNYSGSTVIIVESAQVVQKAAASKKKTVSKVRVTKFQQRRAEQILTEAIRRRVKVQHPEASKMFLSVDMDATDVPIILAGATEECEISAIDPRATGPQPVNIRYQDAKGKWNELKVECGLTQRPQVPVLTHPVSMGQVIHEADVTMHEVDNLEGVLTRMEDVLNKEVKKSLHADEPVHPDDVRGVPLVRANDIVTGIWKSHGIRITGQFKSKSDGGFGETITLIKLTGRDELTARVTDLHEAEIVAPDSAATANRGGADDDDDTNASAVSRRSAAATTRTALRVPPTTTSPSAILAGGEMR